MAEFPQHWWKSSGRPLIFAHRGASLQAPENTLAAFQKAVDLGADGIELDVRLTADDVPVVIHDAQVGRTTHGSGSVYGIPLQELRALKVTSPGSDVYADEYIPTLVEVFAEFGTKTIINIELKSFRDKDNLLVESVCALIKKMALEKRVWFSSFSPTILVKTRAVLPEVPNGYLFTSHTLVQRLRQKMTPFEAVHPYFLSITQNYVNQMHRNNKRVVVWTVDSEKEAKRCSAFGVDIVISNDPAKLIKVLT